MLKMGTNVNKLFCERESEIKVVTVPKSIHYFGLFPLSSVLLNHPNIGPSGGKNLNETRS